MTRIKHNVWQQLCLIATLLAFAIVSAACGPGPKSQSLTDLERQLQDPSAKEVKTAPGASKPYREARQYRRLALESWEDGKSEVSQEYAVLGMLRYRTAAAISEQHEAKARLETANAKVTNSNPEIKALNQTQLKLSDEVAALEVQVSQARRKSEEAKRRTQALASQQNMAQGAMPAMEMMEGIVLAVGGALLITPGFLTDTLGFLCLIPVTRRALIRGFIARSQVNMHGFHHKNQPPDSDNRPSDGKTIDGEYHRHDR